MNVINRTSIFINWLIALKDPIAKALITKRIERAKKGNFGDHKFLRNEIWEMRINTGKGYRVYYAREGEIIYLLLCGGDKTTQEADIKQALEIWESLKN